jgi:uncharacterized OB-fold protein
MGVSERPNWTEGLPVRIGNFSLGRAEGSPETAGYWEGVDQDELRLKHCPECGQFLHPRRIVCSNCAGTALEWRRVEGDGEVYTFSELHRAPLAELNDAVPYHVGMVQLKEGVCLFARLFPQPNAPVQIGAPVKVDFRHLEAGGKLPVFVVQGR